MAPLCGAPGACGCSSSGGNLDVNNPTAPCHWILSRAPNQYDPCWAHLPCMLSLPSIAKSLRKVVGTRTHTWETGYILLLCPHTDLQRSVSYNRSPSDRSPNIILLFSYLGLFFRMNFSHSILVLPRCSMSTRLVTPG